MCVCVTIITIFISLPSLYIYVIIQRVNPSSMKGNFSVTGQTCNSWSNRKDQFVPRMLKVLWRLQFRKFSKICLYEFIRSLTKFRTRNFWSPFVSFMFENLQGYLFGLELWQISENDRVDPSQSDGVILSGPRGTLRKRFCGVLIQNVRYFVFVKKIWLEITLYKDL